MFLVITVYHKRVPKTELRTYEKQTSNRPQNCTRTTPPVAGMPTFTGTKFRDASAAAMASTSLLRQRWKALSPSPCVAQYSRCVCGACQ